MGELERGAARVRMDQISNLERVNSLDFVSVESWARRGKIFQRMHVALLVTACKYLV
jgi:hypothetical protein